MTPDAGFPTDNGKAASRSDFDAAQAGSAQQIRAGLLNLPPDSNSDPPEGARFGVLFTGLMASEATLAICLSNLVHFGR